MVPLRDRQELRRGHILFTLIVKVLVFPFSVKQQKSMASQAKVQKKVKELQKIYATTR